MTIKEAAHKLRKTLDPHQVSVGMGDGVIVIYEHVRGLSKQRTLKEYEGYPVQYKYIGKVKLGKY